MRLLPRAPLRSARYLPAVALLTSIFCGPIWGADPAPPDESAPLDIRMVTVSGQAIDLHIFRDPNAGLPWLNFRLRQTHHTGILQSCRALAGVYLTRYEQAFGRVCQFKDGEQMAEVKICADTAVGNFSVVPLGDGGENPEAIAKFVAENCAGG